MLLLAPGPEAWAQAVSSVQGGARPVAAGPALVPLTSAPSSLSKGFQLTGSLTSSVLPALTPAPHVRTALKPQAVASAAPIQAPAAALARPVAVQTVQAAFKAPTLKKQVQALSQETAPVLEILAAPAASQDSLKSGGADLQLILEGRKASKTSAEVYAPASLPGQPSGLSKAQAQQASEQTVPAPELTPGQKTKFRFYAGGVAAVKVAIETLNLAVPLLMLAQAQAAVAIGALYLSAEVAGLFANFIGGALVDKVGAGRTMVLTGFLQAAAIALLPAALVMGGPLAMPAVYALFVLNGVAGEVFDVARRAAMPMIVGKDEGVLRKYNGGLYVWREIAATTGVFAAGWLLKGVGAMATIWVHPAFALAAALAMLKLWKLRPSEEPAPRPARKASSLKDGLRDMIEGARIVLRDSNLRTIVLINMPLAVVHKVFHTLIAVIYAAKVLGDPAMAAILIGAWNLGELAGAWILERWGKESRMSSWLRLAAAASLSMWLYWLFPAVWVAVPVSFLIAMAMIGNELGTASYLQAQVPEKSLGAATGFVYGFARAMTMLSLLGCGWLFDALGPMNGILAMAVLFTLIAPVYFFSSRRFADQKMPGDAVPSGD